MSFTNLMKKLLATLMFWKKQIPPSPVVRNPMQTVEERRAKFQRQIQEVHARASAGYPTNNPQAPHVTALVKKQPQPQRLQVESDDMLVSRLASLQIDDEPTVYIKPHEHMPLQPFFVPTCESDHEHRRPSPVSSPSHSSYDSPSHSHSSYSSCSGSSHSSSDSSCSSSSSSSCGD